MQPLGSTQGNARARVNVQLDVQAVGSNRYNARARMDVEEEGSCRNPRAQVSAMRVRK